MQQKRKRCHECGVRLVVNKLTRYRKRYLCADCLCPDETIKISERTHSALADADR
jgi:hypothetical protein